MGHHPAVQVVHTLIPIILIAPHHQAQVITAIHPVITVTVIALRDVQVHQEAIIADVQVHQEASAQEEVAEAAVMEAAEAAAGVAEVTDKLIKAGSPLFTDLSLYINYINQHYKTTQ